MPHVACPNRLDGACLLGLFGGRPHIGVCLRHYPHCRRRAHNPPPARRTGGCRNCGLSPEEKAELARLRALKGASP